MKKTNYKTNVKLEGIQPITVEAIETVRKYLASNYPTIDFWVTSVLDGKHMTGSLHYKGLAFDMRSRDLNHPYLLVIQLRRILLGWDIVLERDHIHLEYDPKQTQTKK